MPEVVRPHTVHLLCNSHLDPVWLWEWPEGAGEALALARTVCDLCEEFDGFVFNRNEVQFYEWIEEYDLALFTRIRRLVARGQWHVMGGWYLQPDCNLPSGESFVRQILVGKRYFKAKFGVEPTVAVNLDPFGHSRGLVQILRKSGYDGYLFCRPKRSEATLPAAEFTWIGFDGSEITAALAESHYNSAPGEARTKIEQWITRYAGRAVCLVPWGVGNHGGGPSRKDLSDIESLMAATETAVIHSTPERYFEDLRARTGTLPKHAGDLNPWAVGCYTSMMRLKRLHRRLENELYLTEKLAATAAFQGLTPYPGSELSEAMRSLLASEFHDVLPGSSISSVEEGAIAELGHGLTLVTRAKTRAFFAMMAGQKPGKPGTYPILVYNPHPFTVETIVECEIQPAWPDHPEMFGVPVVSVGRKQLPAQAEKEESNINEDHRKRVAFRAKLRPSCMNRFDCRIEKVIRAPAPSLRPRKGKLRFRTADIEVVINTRTGLIDRYRVRGEDFLSSGAGVPLLMRDDANPWAMNVVRFRTPAGRFKLASQTDSARIAGVAMHRLPAVRVIEDGPVRVVVEALFRSGDSTICQRYKLPRTGTEVEVETRVHWSEKDRMLKLSFPTPWSDGALVGQVAYGVQELPSTGDEAVAQKWIAVTSPSRDRALSIINDTTYGCDARRGEVRVSLLRAPAHAAHPSDLGTPLLEPDRYTPRIDQGEHVFRFWLNGGPMTERLTVVDREALLHNEQPYALSCWPSGGGSAPKSGPVLSDRAIQVVVFKLADGGKDFIIRLFEPTGKRRTTTLSIPCANTKTRVKMAPFEIKTLRINRRSRRLRQVSLLEE
jgi:alpha-mannosidase